MKLAVQVQQDHIKKLTSSDPIKALAELVWNALDADATQVEIEFEVGHLGIEEVIIRDNGLGMTLDEARAGFSSLGGSWKGHASRTKTKKRILHGREGKGRFKAFALGSPVEWVSISGSNGLRQSLMIVGDFASLREFELQERIPSAEDDSGTSVKIMNVTNGIRDLRSDEARHELIQLLAPYLASYPDVSIIYDGASLDLAAVSEGEPDVLDIDPIKLDNGKEVDARLSVTTWTFPNERKLALCDARGFTLAEVPAGKAVRAPGFNFTAYLCSDYFKVYHETGSLEIAEMFAEDEGVGKLLSAARKRLAAYFRERMEERTTALIEEWRQQDIYPYKEEPKNDVEQGERKVFNILALNVDRHLPGFQTMEPEAQRLLFQCVKIAIDSGEESTRRLVESFSNLPENKRRSFLDLVAKHSWGSIIEATNAVSDRLDFLAGLRNLLFEPDLARVTKERSQLQHLLAKNVWLFGEHFSLTVADKGLTEVLKRHEKLLGRKPTGKKVTRSGGHHGIVDLMLSGRVSPSDEQRLEHLVVELKAPQVLLSKKELDQIESYAMAVVDDPAFGGCEAEWHFFVICNKIDDYVKKKRSQKGLPKGVVYSPEDGPKVTVWAKEWGEIIQACDTRLRFFKDRLQYTPTKEEGMVHLAKEYAKYVPAAVLQRAENVGNDEAAGTTTKGEDDHKKENPS